jgi:hypothetical protein
MKKSGYKQIEVGDSQMIIINSSMRIFNVAGFATLPHLSDYLNNLELKLSYCFIILYLFIAPYSFKFKQFKKIKNIYNKEEERKKERRVILKNIFSKIICNLEFHFSKLLYFNDLSFEPHCNNNLADMAIWHISGAKWLILTNIWSVYGNSR